MTNRDLQLAFYQAATGELAYWIVSSNATIRRFGTFGVVPVAWAPVGAGDLTGDGVEDLVWAHTSGGTLIGWRMTAADVVGATTPLPSAPSGWHLDALADLDGDGRADYVWRSTSSGEIVVWLMNAAGSAIATSTSLGSVPSPWRIAAAGDIDGDGRADLVWENPASGAHVVWRMSGGTWLATVDLGIVPTNWSIAAVADLDDDGSVDVFWRERTTGALIAWLMQRTSYRSTVSLGGTPPAWALRAVRRTGSRAVSSGLTLDRTSATVLLDASLALTLTGTDASGAPVSNASAIWRSSAPAVATVDAQGTVRAYAIGQATVTATVGALAAQVVVTVAPHLTEIATGGSHACGVAGTGQTFCWGYNGMGELGTTTPFCSQFGGQCSAYPVAVDGAVRFVSLTAGEFHTCGLTAAGKAYCWGGNPYGQLGTASTAPSVTTPTAVVGSLTFTSLVAGRMHTCGTATDGETYCWGWDGAGQLGAGVVAPDRCTFFAVDEPCSRTPVRVTGARQFVAITAAEKSTCALTRAGDAFCWGLVAGAGDGSSCVGFTGCTRTPVLQPGQQYTQFFDRDAYQCGRVASGNLYCTGVDFSGAFGTGASFTRTSTPLISAWGYAYASYTLGRRHTCAQTDVGLAVCWGANESGQTGSGMAGADQLIAVGVGGGLRFTRLFSSAQSEFTCGIAETGRAYCWGSGGYGELGNGLFSSSASPVSVLVVR